MWITNARRINMKNLWNVLLNGQKNVCLKFYLDIEVRIGFGFLHVLMVYFMVI